MLTADVTSIDERIWRIRVPLPGHHIGHLNSYLVVGDSGVVLIDVPWRERAVLHALEHGIRTTGYRLDDVRAILVTHYHEDHAGGASRIQKKAAAPVYIVDLEVSAMRTRYLENGALFESGLLRWLAVVGAPSTIRRFAVEQYRSLREYGELIESAELIDRTTQLAIAGLEICAVPTPGHTAGHCSFYAPASSALFIGDHLFTWGSANATTRPLATGRPLRAHRSSSQQLIDIQAKFVLPGHGDPLESLEPRVEEFAATARRRQDDLLLRCSNPQTVWQLAARTSYHRDWADFSPNSMLSIAGEVHAHLLELEELGKVVGVGDVATLWSTADRSATEPAEGSNQ